MIRNQFARTLTRLSLVCLFPPSAIDKVVNRRQALQQARSGALPGPAGLLGAGELLDVAIAVETIAPVMIVAERGDREAAVVLAGFCAATALLYHQFWTFDDLGSSGRSEGRDHLWEFLKNFGLVGGLMTVALEHRPKPPKPAPQVLRRPPPPRRVPPDMPRRYTAFR